MFLGVSVQALVDQKTMAILKSDARLEDFRRTAHREATADRLEIERLTERLYQEHSTAIHQLRNAVTTIEQAPSKGIGTTVMRPTEMGVGELSNKTLIIEEVRQINRQLEHKLATTNCARERAETRCSAALSEIEAQKFDLVVIATQLQEVEKRQTNTSCGPQPCCLQVLKLQSSLSVKETKLKGLRESLVKMKAEFVAAEEVLYAAP